MKARLTFLFLAAALNCAAALPPVITSAGNTTFTVGVPGSFTFIATNPPLTAGSWQATGDTLPASVTLDPVTGKLAGTPLLANVGTYNISVTVANAGGTSLAKAFTLTIRDVPRVVILKEASPYTQKYYGYEHNALEIDEIAADTAPFAVTFSGTDTAYYILDMDAREYARVAYWTVAGTVPAQKQYSVNPAAPFTSGFIDAMLNSRTANSLDVVFGKANPDPVGDPSFLQDGMTSYRGLASPLAVTTATATVPAWTIPIAVKSLSGKIFDYERDIFDTDPDVTIHQFSFATTTFTANLDAVLTPQANTGGLLPKINPVTGLPKVPAENWDGVVSNTMAYGIQLVRNTLEKLKYSESP